jgi:hypothetical protein
MAISSKPIRPIAFLIAIMFLLAPLSPLVGAAPGDPGDSPLGPGDGEFTAVDDDDTIPIVTVISGPSDDPFGASVTNLGDVDGDGIDDMIIGSGYDYWLEDRPFAPWYGSKQYLLRGKEGRNYTTADLEETGNGSIGWTQHSERWIGDVNGDGHADLVYRINDLKVRANGDIWWEDQYKVYIHYGGEDGFAKAPDTKISILPDGIEPNMTYISFQLGGVGDVNGDGFNDLFVYRHGFEVWDYGSGGGGEPPPGGGRGEDPGNGSNADDPDEPPDKDPPEPWPNENVTYYPPDFQLFYGSEDGLPEEPSWNGTPELEARWYYLQGVHHADVNGDGYSDVVLASTSAPHIQVYHGSDDGISLEPDMTVTFNTQFSYGWSLHAPVNVNGDEYDDVIIDYGQAEGLFDFVQYLYVLPGSELGIPTKPTAEYRLVLDDLSADHNPQVVMADINGDGLDDAFIYATIMTQRTGSDEIRFQVHFNSGDEIPEDPSWQHKYTTSWTVPQLGMADRGDFDADGYVDVAIPAPGEWVWWDDGQSEYTLGHVVIVNAGGIMELMRPLTLREGPDLYAGYKSYTFRVNVNPTGLSNLPTEVQLTLDPDGANVVLEAGMRPGGSYIHEVTDPDDRVTLTSTLEDIIHDSDNNTIWVLFKVEFDWSWPHEELCDAKVGTILNDITTPFLTRDLFWVENDLELLGDLSASASIQGDLEEDDWVRAGEEVTISRPIVVYEGTTDVYPPSGVCNVVLQDNDGTNSSAPNVAGEVVSLVLAMDDATDAEETLMLTLQDLPGLATSPSHPQFRVRVDGDAPSFINVVPGPDDWHASSQVLTGITADDGVTAGVLASSMEYSYSIDDGVTWTDWTTNGLEVGADGLQVDGMVLLTIPDGDDNFVRWRATDLVGNGPATSAAMRIKVDTINVTYTNAFPDGDDWHTSVQVDCGVTIRDEDGAGIEAATIQWRVSHSNLSGYGDWQTWGASTGDLQEISVSQLITMGDSPYNYVQWRAKDLAGNGYTTSPHYRVRVDITPIHFSDLFPEVGPHGVATILCGANVTDGEQGSGIALSSIDFRVFTGGEWGEWINIGMSGSSQHNRISAEATFDDGENNRIQFRGLDVAGNGPAMSEEHYLTVDTTGPEFGDIAPGVEEKQPGSEVLVTITVTDAIVGVDGSAFEYRFGTEGEDSMGEWMEATLTSSGPSTFQAEVSIDFAPGVENVVQFRAVDLLGHGAESQVGHIWVNRAPHAYIKTPTAEDVYRENEEVTLNATLSSDPDEDALNYTWYHDLQVDPIGYGKLLDVNLPVGVYNVTLVVTDDTGAQDEISVLVTVEEYIPPTTETSNVLWWVLLVVVMASIGVAVFVMNRRKGAMDEWEEV